MNQNRNFGNNLVKIVADWNIKFNDELKKKPTFTNTEIKGE